MRARIVVQAWGVAGVCTTALWAELGALEIATQSQRVRVCSFDVSLLEQIDAMAALERTWVSARNVGAALVLDFASKSWNLSLPVEGLVLL